MTKKWIDATKQQPKKTHFYDLCLMDVGIKVLTGWWTGFRWDGLNYENEKVKQWMFKPFEEFHE